MNSHHLFADDALRVIHPGSVCCEFAYYMLSHIPHALYYISGSEVKFF